MSRIFALLLLASPLATSPDVSAMPPTLGNVGILDTDTTPVCGGVLISGHKVLTAAHCVEPGQTLLIRCGGEDIPAEVGKRDADEDLATLDLTFVCKAPFSKPAANDPLPGDGVYALGFPSRSPRISRGIVSGYEVIDVPPYDGKSHKPKTFLATDAAIDPGSSGGGLYNEQGELVGICSMSRGSFGYYSPAHRIRSFLGTTK